jgi:hypothetical protein
MSNQAGVSAPIMQLDPTKTHAAETAKMMTLKPPVEKVYDGGVLPAVEIVEKSKKKPLKTVAVEIAKMMALVKPPKTFKNLNN